MSDTSSSQRPAGISQSLKNAPKKAGSWLSAPGRRVENAFLVLFFLFLAVGLGALIMALTPIWTPFDQDYWFGDCERVSRAGQNLACQDPSERSEIVRNLLFVFAGGTGAGFGLFQLYNAARRTRISEDSYGVDFESERNDRFVKAAELLGNENEAVKVAGIAALERLGLEDKAGYRETVIEVLSGFVRFRTGPDAQARYQEAWLHKQGAAQEIQPEPPGGPDRPEEPVFTAIRALCRLTTVKLPGGAIDVPPTTSLGRKVDLTECHLKGLRLTDAQMRGWNLAYAQLQEADLRWAQLQEANLGWAQLQEAALHGAQLQKAILWGAQLQKADLTEAQLQNASFGLGWLQNANLGATVLDFTMGLKTEQLAQARKVTWPDYVPRPETGTYSEAWEAEQAAMRQAAWAPDESE